MGIPFASERCYNGQNENGQFMRGKARFFAARVFGVIGDFGHTPPTTTVAAFSKPWTLARLPWEAETANFAGFALSLPRPSLQITGKGENIMRNFREPSKMDFPANLEGKCSSLGRRQRDRERESRGR